ncbi:hypothetical protein TanjilG_14315 [Lupinus angustifolius]|uniref:Uncharacterized protein n=1 Tax=Lupinus angustifolius TaxID=3871 RepID=A0A1J7HG01_LUPAN|nr:PREDICTED: uncharacterized protein LOC109347922 isoform X2 [Lupinus angustifolius]OIW11775.1 hypothetical protein TanjilG_14315 [Lupinus angustifolius]
MPLDTTTTTVTTTTTTATSPLPQPRLPHHYPFLQPPQQQEQPFPIHIPNALLPKQSHDPSNPFPFPFLSPARGGGGPLRAAYPQPPSLLYPHGVRAVASPHLDYVHPALHLTRPPGPPPHLQYPHFAYSPVAASVKGGAAVAQPKTTPRSGVPDSKNGYKDTSARESRDDTLTVVRGRRVKITEDASLYALCRSWLRNGINEDIQPQQKDVMNVLPKPLPASMEASNMPNKKEDQKDEDEEDEDEESVEHLSPQDLLKRHVKRAKRVRARSREERLQRIKRYRNRLTLLLPPPGEK